MGTTYHTIAVGNVEWGTQNSARTTNQPHPSVFLQIRLR
jgi:hypothetical protein